MSNTSKSFLTLRSLEECAEASKQSLICIWKFSTRKKYLWLSASLSLSLSLFALSVKEFNLISALRRISSRATWTNGKDGKSNRSVNACLCPPREPETRKEQWNFVIAPTDGKTTKCSSQGLSSRFIHSPFRSCGSWLFCRLSLNRFLRDESRSTFFLMYLILSESDNWSRTTESRSRVYRPLSKMKKSRVLEEKKTGCSCYEFNAYYALEVIDDWLHAFQSSSCQGLRWPAPFLKIIFQWRWFLQVGNNRNKNEMLVLSYPV